MTKSNSMPCAGQQLHVQAQHATHDLLMPACQRSTLFRKHGGPAPRWAMLNSTYQLCAVSAATCTPLANVQQLLARCACFACALVQQLCRTLLWFTAGISCWPAREVRQHIAPQRTPHCTDSCLIGGSC